MVIVLLVALERLAELIVSRRNRAPEAVETGAGHFRLMALMHAVFLAACVVEGHPPLRLWAAALVVLAQALRWWAIGSLGRSWNVRVVVVPGAAPVRRGPYRWVRHPNYAAVIVEVAALPLAVNALWTAMIFSVLNALVLRVRIREEERALGPAWEAAFAGVPRFVPHVF